MSAQTSRSSAGTGGTTQWPSGSGDAGAAVEDQPVGIAAVVGDDGVLDRDVVRDVGEGDQGRGGQHVDASFPGDEPGQVAGGGSVARPDRDVQVLTAGVHRRAGGDPHPVLPGDVPMTRRGPRTPLLCTVSASAAPARTATRMRALNRPTSPQVAAAG